MQFRSELKLNPMKKMWPKYNFSGTSSGIAIPVSLRKWTLWMDLNRKIFNLRFEGGVFFSHGFALNSWRHVLRLGQHLSHAVVEVHEHLFDGYRCSVLHRDFWWLRIESLQHVKATLYISKTNIWKTQIQDMFRNLRKWIAQKNVHNNKKTINIWF